MPTTSGSAVARSAFDLSAPPLCLSPSSRIFDVVRPFVVRTQSAVFSPVVFAKEEEGEEE